MTNNTTTFSKTLITTLTLFLTLGLMTGLTAADEQDTLEVDNAEDLIAAAAGDEVDGESIAETGEIVVAEDIGEDEFTDEGTNAQIEVEGVTLTAEEGVSVAARGDDSFTGSDSRGMIQIIADNVEIKDIELNYNDGDEGSGTPTINIQGENATVDNVEAYREQDDEGNFAQVINADADGATITDSLIDGEGDGLNQGITAQAKEVTVEENVFDVAPGATDDSLGQLGINDTTVTDNDFNDVDANDRFIFDFNGGANLGGIEQDNSFDPNAIVVKEENQIVATPDENEVLNTNSGERFDSGTAIQDAINGADGDHTLLVGSGTYEESVVVNGTSGLEITSKGDPEDTVIRFESDDAYDAVLINEPGTVFDGFTVERADSGDPDDNHAQAISVRAVGDDGEQVNVTNNIVRNVTDGDFASIVGIYVRDGTTTSQKPWDVVDGDVDNVLIEENDVDGFTTGVSIVELSDKKIGESNGIEVRQNELSNNTNGVAIASDNEGDNIHTIDVEGNEILENEKGVYIPGNDDLGGFEIGDDADTSEISVNLNDIVNSSQKGIQVLSSEGDGVDATNNFWGAASGPSGEGQGDESGDSVSEDVTFRPWLLEEDGETYDRTVSLATENDWDALSPYVSAEEVDVANGSLVEDITDSSITAITYSGNEETWRSVDSADMLEGMFIQGADAVGIEEKDEPETISRDLEEGWNLVGAYEGNSVYDQFSPVADSLNSVVSPERNWISGGLDTGETFNFESTDGEDNENKASAFWLRASESATLSTTPTPPEDEE